RVLVPAKRKRGRRPTLRRGPALGPDSGTIIATTAPARNGAAGTVGRPGRLVLGAAGDELPGIGDLADTTEQNRRSEITSKTWRSGDTEEWSTVRTPEGPRPVAVGSG